MAPSFNGVHPPGGTLRNELATAVQDWAGWNEAQMRASHWLDMLHLRMQQGEVHEAMGLLYPGLDVLRRQWRQDNWRRFCLDQARPHPLRELLHQCPYTRHAFERPRGYAGDAALLDYVYTENLPEPEDHTGHAIYRFLYRQAGPSSARERRMLLAREIDTVASQVHAPRILSVACGHLREAELSHAVREGRIGELVAMDQDPLSLAEISRRFPGGPIRTVCESVVAVLKGRLTFGQMDLVYASGLYDYLSDASARRLTRLLFGMLRPGGRLLLANFTPCTPCAGYLEAFMDWWLVYRDEARMRAVAVDIPPQEVASLELFRDSGRNVIYLRLVKH